MVQIHSLRQPLLNQQFTGIRMLVVRLILCINVRFAPLLLFLLISALMASHGPLNDLATFGNN